MNRIVSFLSLVFLGGILSLSAQGKFTGEVELLELDEITATFRVEGIAAKKKDVIEVAKMTVFSKLFYEGVEGFNDDLKMVENENKYWLDNFFKGDKAPYNQFVKGAQLEGSLATLPTGEYQGFANVVINYEVLIRDMEINGVRIDKNASPKEVSTPKPPKKIGIGARNKEKSE